MSYQKQGFYSGGDLYASQLDAMEDGIINAEKLAEEAKDSAANMKKGPGPNLGGTQQLQNQESGVTEGYFNFTNNETGGSKNPNAFAFDNTLIGEIEYGAVGEYSASFGGKSTAIGKRAFSEGTTTIAKGPYSHAEGNNSVTLGANSHAEGKCTVTKGENSHAEGFETIAGEFNSHAEGYKTIAKGSAAHAEGQETKAYSHQSHTEGLRTVAGDETNPELGAYAHAEGVDTVAKGEASHASGIGTIAIGRAQTVVGRYNPPIAELDQYGNPQVLFMVGNGVSDTERDAAFIILENGEALSNYVENPTSDYSLINLKQFNEVLSARTTTRLKNGNGENSIVGGINSIADYNCDFTFGEGLSNTFEHQTIFGKYNDISDWGGNRPLFMIGNGTDADHRSNAFEVRNNGLVVVGNKVQQMPDNVADGFDFTGKNANATALDTTLTGIIPYGATGDFAAAFGGKCAATGKRSHAEGTTTIAKGDYSHSEGNATVALGPNSHAEGRQTVAAGNTAHAEGTNTIAMGGNHAEGDSTIAEGYGSHAEGYGTYTQGGYSHAEGSGTKAQGLAAHAEGVDTEAQAEGSHAEGKDSQAMGAYSHAEGFNAAAHGDCSHSGGEGSSASGKTSFAHGGGLRANYDYQTVFGKWNKNKNTTLFEIGNGADESHRLNIFEVYEDGDIGIYKDGKIYSLHKMLAAYFTDANLK